MPLKRSSAVIADQTPTQEPGHAYAVSDDVQDRRSVFVGYYSPSLPATALQRLPQLKTADHRIAAWRGSSKQKTLFPSPRQAQLFDVGHDDDGESWAGKRLEKVLEEMEATGSVVVARWYGGVLLGPVRFRHIEAVAAAAIRRWRESSDPSRKRRRTEVASPATPGPGIAEDMEGQRKALIAELRSRDESIVVLRKLLVEKKAELGIKVGSQAAAKAPLQSPQYESFSMVRLQQLEKARDASIAFILKELDRIEAQKQNP